MLKSLIRLTLIICLIYLWVSNPIPFVLSEDIVYNFNSQSQKIISIRGGGFSNKGNRSRKPKNFDANFHRILQKGFPDWERRIEYEKRQRELYESAQKKLKMSPIGISSSEKLSELFSLEEKDAIAYFQGTGFYAYCQKLEERPNVFDTRETFLLKMHNPEMRENFLNALNRLSEKNLE
jgi:hypothetical protein